MAGDIPAPYTNGVDGPSNGTSAMDATSNTADSTTAGLSADEIALYDRQIRLWGAQAQERIRSANILLISLRALGTEIAKNLTLAGINSLTIADDSPITEEDLGAQYFLRNEDIGKPRAVAAIPRIQELNPRVTVKSGGSLQNLLLQNQNYYTPFDVVIACDLDFNTTCNINDACHLAGRPFYAAGIHGFYGYVFVDLKAHEFVVEREKSNKPTQLGPESETRSILAVTDKPDVPSNGKKMEMVKKQERYCPLRLANTSPLPADTLANRRKLKSVPPLLPCLRALFDFQSAYSRLPTHTTQDLGVFATLVNLKSQELTVPPLSADSLRSFLHNLGAEIVPTAAFVGGRLSEDVINVLGKREQPIQNFALFDGDAMDGRIYCLYTKPPELLVGPELMAMGMGGMPMQVDLGGANVGNGVGMALGGTGVNGDVGYGVPMEVVGGAPAGAENASVGNGVDGEVAGRGADAAAAPSTAATTSAPTSAPAKETGVTNDA